MLGVLVSSNNELIVVFDVEPSTLDSQAYDSAVNPDNYVLTTVDPTEQLGNGGTAVPIGEVAPSRFPNVGTAIQDVNDPLQVAIGLDAAMEPGVRYDLVVNDVIAGAAGETFAGEDTWRVLAPKLSRQPRQAVISVERYRDLDWIINPGPDEVAETWRQESSGDIALQDAATSLRKRLYRRVFTRPGEFAWMPAYGVGLAVKSLVKSGRLQELANLIAEQARKEPDVLNAGVEVYLENTSTGSFLNVEMRIQQRNAVTRRLNYREPV